MAVVFCNNLFTFSKAMTVLSALLYLFSVVAVSTALISPLHCCTDLLILVPPFLILCFVLFEI